MDSEELNITSLKDSIKALSVSIDVFKANMSSEDIGLKNTLRSGVIQNFETAYELGWKFMKKWLEANVSPDIVSGVSRKEFYRIAHQNGLISSVNDWWNFHNARNRTSHIYSVTTAEEVLEAAFGFLAPAQKFAADLEKKL
ncbi:MAG: nucleotidyltransferase substrate binding protein [Chitinispirillales bacterium]|jgi:nucleotidyltransferase substrate binding protein (TIGR01987 family)|nr:nucleotidyltransferase substrate binding protein [Chitinispirillales bacterium]